MPKPIPVEPMDKSKKNSAIAGPIEEESTVMMDTSSKSCHWNGQEFDEGTIVCDNGTAYECSLGQWVKRKEPC